jgi:hypothetical protein
MSRYVKSWTVVALLLFASALYCLYWMQSRGAFSRAPIKIPIQLTEGASASVRFVGVEKGDHYVEIEYPADASKDVRYDLERIVGNVSLSSHGMVVARAILPMRHGTYANGRHAMILFTVPTKPRTEYVLSLEITRIPADLAGSQGDVKVELDPHYNLIFPQTELLGVLLVVLGLFCLVPGIRLKAGHLKFPFLILLATSLAITGLGYAGLMLISPSSFAGWRWSMVQVCFLFVMLGPVAFVLSLVSWFAASVIRYFRSYRARSSP